MKKLFLVIFTVLFCLVSNVGWTANLACKYTGFNCPEVGDIEELVEVDGLFFKKFTETPFTGKVTGNSKGSFKDGLREGSWVVFFENGQLNWKGNYKDGKRDGPWEEYFDDSGKWWAEVNYKDGIEVGLWKYWHDPFENELSAELTWVDESSVDGDITAYYVDFGSIRKRDGYVYWWDLSNYSKPFQGHLSAKYYNKGDCKLFRYKYLSASFHKEPMGGGYGDIDNELDKEWGYPQPNSSGGLILKSVCDM